MYSTDTGEQNQQPATVRICHSASTLSIECLFCWQPCLLCISGQLSLRCSHVQPTSMRRSRGFIGHLPVKPNTHRRRRRNSTVELSRVGGVNAPVSSRDPVYNFLSCWAAEVGDKWWQAGDKSLFKKLSISIKIHAVKPLWNLSNQFPNCRSNRSAVVVS